MVHLVRGGEKNFGWDSSENLHDFQERFSFTLWILTVWDRNLPGSSLSFEPSFLIFTGVFFFFLKESVHIKRFDLSLSSMIVGKLCSHSQPLLFSERIISIAPTRIAVQLRRRSQNAHSCALRGFGHSGCMLWFPTAGGLGHLAASSELFTPCAPLHQNASPCSSCIPVSAKMP